MEAVGSRHLCKAGEEEVLKYTNSLLRLASDVSECNTALEADRSDERRLFPFINNLPLCLLQVMEDLLLLLSLTTATHLCHCTQL